MVFVRAVNDIQNNFDFIVRNGVAQLMQGMTKAREFDPNNPFSDYNEKNEYFNGANNICQISLWKSGLYDLCERYYAILLQEIKRYETTSGTNFNKGMVYANLGVSQAAQGKIDEGFANILKAHIEDEPYHRTDPSKSVFNLDLYIQFEDIIKNYVVQHSKLYRKEEATTINAAFINSLFSSLDTDSRLLLVTQIEKIRRNFAILKDKDNRFTRLQIFLSLQDLCLSVENSLKNKNSLTDTMKPLLDSLFSTGSGRPRAWKPIFDSNYNLTRADSISEFQTNLSSILAIGDSNSRRLLMLCAVRNFSAHNLDVGNKYVFKRIGRIFDNILSAIFFLHQAGCL
jgi:hypothetical protein